jgi:GDPmannose 4,6-dehydratase
MILQHHKPDDFVIATGTQISVREFLIIAAKELGIHLKFSGTGENEIAVIDCISKDIDTHLKSGDIIVRVDSKYYRPAEVDTLLGSSKKAMAELGWKPEITINEMIKEMIMEDLKSARECKFLKQLDSDEKPNE